MRIFCIVVIFLLLSALAEADVLFDNEYYTETDTAVITLNDPNANTDPNSIQDVTLKVTSESDPNGITISAKETDINTSKFTTSAFGNDLGFTLESSDDVIELIQVSDGDTITVTYDESDWNDTAEINFVDPNAPEESPNNDETHATPDSPGFTFENYEGCFIDTASASVKLLFH